MEQKPPAQRNTFVIVAAVLFNLLWIGLLFLSCQADDQPVQTPTPDARMEENGVWQLAANFELEPTFQSDVQTRGMGDPVPRKITTIRNYSVPLYKPPSTCSIAPVI